MAQFDVYANPFGNDPARPFIIELQADILAETGIAIVAPLRPAGAVPLAARLNPVLQLPAGAFALFPTEMVSVRRKLLGAPVASLADARYDILAALDLVFTGI